MSRLHVVRRRFVLGSSAALVSIALVRTRARAAQFEFKCASFYPAEHPSSQRLLQMWADVERESGGRIRATLFPNSQLGGDAAMLSQLRLGALHFDYITPANLAAAVPAASISDIGFAFAGEEEGLRALDGPLGEFVRREVAAKDLHALRTFWNGGTTQITSGTHPIRTPDDLRGFKIRVAPSKILIDLFAALGANPISTSTSELYTALQTKLVDGEAAALASIETQRWYEVQQYVSMTNHAWNGAWLVANGDAWSALPTDLREIAERNNARYAALERKDTIAFNTALVAKLASQGLAVNQVDQGPFRARLREYYREWAGVFGPTAWGLLEKSLRRQLR